MTLWDYMHLGKNISLSFFKAVFAVKGGMTAGKQTGKGIKQKMALKTSLKLTARH